MKRRVVITGLGIIAPNGNGTADFELALRKGRSGIRYQQQMEDSKFACRVAGVPQGIDELAEAAFPQDLLMAMNMGHRYASLAAREAWTEASAKLIREHYAEHKGKPFYGDLVSFMTSDPVVALVLEGNRAIEVARRLIGTTNSSEAQPGTIRGDLGLSFSNNLVHGSDGPKAARRELALFFPARSETIRWTPVTEKWVYSSEELPPADKPGRKK